MKTVIALYNRLNKSLKFLYEPIPIILGVILTVFQINDYFTPDPMEQVLIQIEESQRALNELKVVDIPDSLKTDLVKDARILQQRLIAYAKIINSCNAIYSDNNLLDQQWRLMCINNASQAAIAAGNSMTDFIKKISIKHRDELDLSVMYTPNISFDTRSLENEQDNAIKKLKNAKAYSDKLEIVNDLITSDAVREFIKNRNDFIRSAFEYLNVVQLSLVYNLDIGNLSHVTNGK